MNPPPLLTESEMDALVTQGVFRTWVCWVGGRGHVSIAEPVGATPTTAAAPRYHFDPARRTWHASYPPAAPTAGRVCAARPGYRTYVAGATPNRQERLIGDDSLPLFSGTAPPGRVEVFTLPPATHQAAFAACRFCHDTGRTSAGFCPCPAGAAARERQREAAARECQRETAVRDAAARDAAIRDASAPYLYSDETYREITIRTGPDDLADLDEAAALRVATAHLHAGGAAPGDWQLHAIRPQTYNKITLVFIQP